MLKKKGTLSFKPKAPQVRKPPSAPPATSALGRQSVERPSDTPAPTTSTAKEGESQSIPAAADKQAEQSTSLTHAQEPTSDSQFGLSTPASSAVTVSTPAEASTVHEERINVPAPADEQPQVTYTGSPEVSARPLVPNVRDEVEQPTTSDGQPAESRSVARAATPEPAALNILEPTLLPTPESTARAPEPEMRGPEPLGLPPREADLSNLAPGASLRPSHSVPSATLNDDGSTTVDGAPLAPRRKPTRATKKRPAPEPVGDEVRTSIEVAPVKRRRKAPTRKPGKPKAQRKPRTREDTPSDAEEMEVDHTTTKMADLTKDIKIGKKFSRHAELKQRERERQQRARVTREMSDPPPDAEEQPSRLPGREAAPENSTGPQMRIINGQIVVDDASLVVDRHAIAAAQATEMEEYEEDDFTRITTSGTYMKRERNITWTLEATEKFYIGLRMFGTDFEMISKMFPDRNRRQIKLKFNKEEREYPKRISNALIGETVKIDFEEYKSHTGLEYETTEDIKAEHAKYEEEHLDEQARLLSEAAEQTRQKRAAISGKLGSAGGTDSAKENDGPSGIGFEDTGKGGKGKKGKVADKKKKKKNLNSVQGGGEEVEVLGTID